MIFQLPPVEVQYSLAAIVFALCLATIAVALLCRGRPDRDYSELAARTRTWWVIVGLFGGALLLGKSAALLLLTAVSMLALREFYTLSPGRDADRRVRLWTYLAAPVQYWWAYLGYYGLFIVFIPVYMFFLLPIRALLIGQTTGFIAAMASLHWALMTTVFCLSHAGALLTFVPEDPMRVAPQWPSEAAQHAPGPGLLLLLVLMTQANDIAQYLWGKSVGRRKVAPSVSPGKTWGGLLGGVATTVALTALVAPRLTMLDLPRSLMAGALIGVGGFFGDLTISAMKRDLGVKDSGTLLPGHGGILDRMDSLIFTAPLFFHFVRFLY